MTHSTATWTRVHLRKINKLERLYTFFFGSPLDIILFHSAELPAGSKATHWLLVTDYWSLNKEEKELLGTQFVMTYKG